MLVKGIVFPESRMAQPMELPLYPRGPRGGEALVAQGLHRSSNRGEPGLGELLPSAPPPRGLSPPGVPGFGVFIGFKHVARFNLLGVLQVTCCSSQIPGRRQAAALVHQVRADLSAPEPRLQQPSYGSTARPATWGKCQFPAFSAQSHPTQGAWGTRRYTQRSLDVLNPRVKGTELQQSWASPSLPTSSLGFPRAAPSFAAPCTAFGACAAPTGGEALKK